MTNSFAQASNTRQLFSIGSSYGTFGEFLQGVLPNDKHFLVTAPIQLYSQAHFLTNQNPNLLSVHPANKKKSLQLAHKILDYFQKPKNGNLIIRSQIPEGKGLASSSADLVATARAIVKHHNLPCNNELIEKFIAEIEPSDGVMFEGVVSYYHREVKLKEVLGTLPQIVFAAIDEGGHIDTLEYNKIPKIYSEETKNEYATLLDEITKAIRKQDLYGVGKVSTQSAILNQTYNPKKSLADLLQLNNLVGGLGIIAAHSGSCLAILLDAADKSLEKKITQIRQAVTNKGYSFTLYNSMVFDNQILGEAINA